MSNQPTGVYSKSITIPSSIDESDTTCGSISVAAYFLKNGLYGKYYTNWWFSGVPALEQSDSNINFNWGTSDIIEDVATDYVSIEWLGFIQPLYSENYVFSISSNDGIQVMIGETVIIDSLTSIIDDSSTLTLSSNPIPLLANQYVPIKVKYYNV